MNPAQLSQLSQTEFTQELGGIFEHSAWIAERAWLKRPFASLHALHAAMSAVLAEASPTEQLNLILAHPELAGREAAAGTLTADSTAEQRSAGLDQCSPQELALLRELNRAYREKFGFPFIIAVRGRSRQQIIAIMQERLKNDRAAEFTTCLEQIGIIARLRLQAAYRENDPVLLRVEALSAAAFAPFGEVIEASSAAEHFTINDGNTERFHNLAKLDPGADGHIICSIFRGQARSLPFSVTMMERHPRASQAFVPLSGLPWLAVVAAPGKEPRAEDLRVFLCRGDQGVNYARGVWHHPLLGLEQTVDFLVLDRSGSGPNCDIIHLEIPGLIPSATINT